MATINKGPSVSDVEAMAYLDYLEKKYHRSIAVLEIVIDGATAHLTFEFVKTNKVSMRRIKP